MKTLERLGKVDESILRAAGIRLESSMLAPWPDHNGAPIYEGDTIWHPDGTEGKVVFLAAEDEPSDQWQVDYGDVDGILHRLCLQIGDKGMARVVRHQETL